MTRQDWDKRQQQWERFHAWEAEHAADRLSPGERLAEVGALVDLALARSRLGRVTTQDLKKAVEGIVLMRHRLAALGRAA